MITDNEEFTNFNPGHAWLEYPPKKTLYPSDDIDEVNQVEAMDASWGGKNIKKKNKTRKDKRKKYKTKKKKRKN